MPSRIEDYALIGDCEAAAQSPIRRSEDHTSELQSPCNLVCRLLLEKKKKTHYRQVPSTSTCSRATALQRPFADRIPFATLHGEQRWAYSALQTESPAAIAAEYEPVCAC